MPCDVDPPHLTFWHWSGVTPYTSSCEFAGSCVFGKQSPGNLSLRPLYPKTKRQALFRRYGRYFAEFLEDLSLVRLGLLDLTTCVGLRYGFTHTNLRGFSWKHALSPSRCPEALVRFTTRNDVARIYLKRLPHSTDTNPIMCVIYNAPSPHRICMKLRNINRMSIGSSFRHSLRPD